jgi:ethanolamine-phosphate cytidylyltransferase
MEKTVAKALGMIGIDREVDRRSVVAIAAVTAAFAVYQYPEAFFGIRRGTLSSWAARALDRHAARRRKRRPVRVYMDGCFDLAHFGHANALRQAKACGDELIVGLVPDDEIRRCKGPPVLNEDERRAVVESFRWVDEMILDVPYDINPEFMRRLWREHRIDYIVHGDDPCLLPDGTDAYAAPKKEGRFKTIKRTEGVSTTDIVGRMLAASTQARRGFLSPRKSGGSDKGGDESREKLSHFCTTSRRVAQFSDGGGGPIPPGARVVYVHGAFDMFHAGHVHLLEGARELGDYVLVGVHEDEAVRSARGASHPILNQQERSLGAMACKHADEVIMGVPEVVTRDLIATFNVAAVVAETPCGDALADTPADPNAVPKEMGIFREVPKATARGAELTTATIIQRVADDRAAYEERNERKNKSEASYYELKSSGKVEKSEERG